MRRRLREMPSEGELAALYASPHDHLRWADHRVRVDVTVALTNAWLSLTVPPCSVGDLSCGDAAIPRRIHGAGRPAEDGPHGPPSNLHLGDLAAGYAYTGPIEVTIREVPNLDVFVCCETIEHLDNPDVVLEGIRAKASRLVLSTPYDEQGKSNPEHLWSWNEQDVAQLLLAVGWHPQVLNLLDLRPMGYLYCYQIWLCT
jgi:hypothetical protein